MTDHFLYHSITSVIYIQFCSKFQVGGALLQVTEQSFVVDCPDEKLPFIGSCDRRSHEHMAIISIDLGHYWPLRVDTLNTNYLHKNRNEEQCKCNTLTDGNVRAICSNTFTCFFRMV